MLNSTINIWINQINSIRIMFIYLYFLSFTSGLNLFFRNENSAKFNAAETQQFFIWSWASAISHDRFWTRSVCSFRERCSIYFGCLFCLKFLLSTWAFICAGNRISFLFFTSIQTLSFLNLGNISNKFSFFVNFW